MNFIDIILIVLALLTVIHGYSNGLIRSLISLLKYIIGLPVAFFVSDKYNIAVYNNFVREAAVQKVAEGISSSADLNAFSDSVKNAVGNLPFGMSGIIDLSFLDNATQENIAEKIVNGIVEPLALVVIKILLFVLTLSLFYLIIFVITKIFGKFEKSKHMPLKKTNKVLGAVFGAAKAVAVLAVLSAVLLFVRDFIFASSQNEFVNQVDSSAVLEFINKNNPFMDFV